MAYNPFEFYEKEHHNQTIKDAEERADWARTAYLASTPSEIFLLQFEYELRALLFSVQYEMNARKIATNPQAVND